MTMFHVDIGQISFYTTKTRRNLGENQLLILSLPADHARVHPPQINQDGR